MLKLIAFILCHMLAMCSADITEGTELVMAFMVHRHGDRTPTEESLVYSTDPHTLIRLAKPYGYGQLTDKGKHRAYQLGKFIRYRYNELLGPKYNESNVYIRSTDKTRTKMSILAAMAAIYPPGLKSWCREINWTPVPYTTVPKKYDWNLAYLSCPPVVNATEDAYNTFHPDFKKYNQALKVATYATNQDIVHNPANIFHFSDVLDVQMSFGMALPKYVEAVLPDIQEAAALGLDKIFEGDSAVFQAGVLLEQFFKYSSLAIAGNDTQRIRIYSAHDYNVYAFEIVTMASPRQGVPKYASLYSLELRRVTSTGEFVVLPVYLPQPGKKVIYLKIKGCEQLCDYNTFGELTKDNSMNYRTWLDQCGITQNFGDSDFFV